MIIATEIRFDPMLLHEAWRVIDLTCEKTSKPNYPAVYGFALMSRDGTYADGIAGAGGGSTVDGDFRIRTPLYHGYLGEVLDRFAAVGRIARARLLVHRQSAWLPPHTDGVPPAALNPERSLIRCHVPIVPSSACTFTVGGDTATMAEAGRLYFFPAWLPHEVRHEGEAERVHLVFSYILSRAELEAFNAGDLPLAGLFDRLPAAPLAMTA